MIPRVIHYCWFGNNEKSELIKKCIESWKHYAPDFEIKEWNETNTELSEYIYAEQAYNNKRYAFVSDVVRFDVLYKYGGIYLDTDVELIKPIDKYINNNLFLGYDQKGLIASGLIMGCEAGQPIVKKIMDYYKHTPFLLSNGRPNMTTVVTIVSDILMEQKIILNGKYYQDGQITLYPSELFDPFDYENDKMNLTEKTVSIHHYASSWKSDKDMKIYAIGRIIKKIVGNNAYNKIARLKHKIWG